MNAHAEQGIVYDQLTKQQKLIYDQYLKVPGHSPTDPALMDLVGFVKRGPKSRIRHAQAEQQENIRREAELVVLHLERGLVPQIKICKNCELKFASDYKYITFCGDECMSEHMLREYGLKWNPAKTPAERWGTPQIPSVIGPPALERLMPIFESIAAKKGNPTANRPVIEDLDDDPFKDL